jgi:formyl-CoA transferase
MHRGYFVALDHHEMGPAVYNNALYRLPRTLGRPQCAAPLLGQHNQLVFNGILGIDDAKLAELEAAGAFK